MKRGEKQTKMNLKEEHKAQNKYGFIQMMKIHIMQLHKPSTLTKVKPLQKIKTRDAANSESE